LQEFLHEQGNKFTKTPNRYRVRLRERDQLFLQNYVQERRGSIEGLRTLEPSSLSESKRNIRSNALLFLDRLNGELDQSKQDKLAQYVLQRCFLVAVWTPDLDSAYQTFKVLNDRGLDLSHADILKAEVVGKVTPNKEDEYNKKWEDTEEALG